MKQARGRMAAGTDPFSGEALADSIAARTWEEDGGRDQIGGKSVAASPAYLSALQCACSWGQLRRVPSQERI